MTGVLCRWRALEYVGRCSHLVDDARTISLVAWAFYVSYLASCCRLSFEVTTSAPRRKVRLTSTEFSADNCVTRGHLTTATFEP